MGQKEITKKSSTMDLYQKNYRNKNSFKKKDQTKHKIQACKRIKQSCYDLKIEVPEKVLSIEKSLNDTYNKIQTKEYKKDHFTGKGMPRARKHKKIPISLDRDFVLV